MLHDNASPHTATHSVESLRQLKFEVWKHPPYSLDLPPDCRLFGPLKDALRGRHFASDQEVKKAVLALLVTHHHFFLRT
jgi:hypothetical protein